MDGKDLVSVLPETAVWADGKKTVQCDMWSFSLRIEHRWLGNPEASDFRAGRAEREEKG